MSHYAAAISFGCWSVAALYFAGVVLNYALTVGWLNAHLQAKSGEPTYENLALAHIFGFFFSFAWPIVLPFVYLVTERARDGWSLRVRSYRPCRPRAKEDSAHVS